MRVQRMEYGIYRWRRPISKGTSFQPREDRPPRLGLDQSERDIHAEAAGLPETNMLPPEYRELHTVRRAWRVCVLQIHW